MKNKPPEKQISQEQIRKYKESLNLTNAEIAAKAGLTRQQVWNLLNIPFRFPSLHVIEGLTKAFNCSIDDLREKNLTSDSVSD